MPCGDPAAPCTMPDFYFYSPPANVCEPIGEGGRAKRCLLSGGSSVGFSRIQKSEESRGCIGVLMNVAVRLRWMDLAESRIVKKAGAAEQLRSCSVRWRVGWMERNPA